MQPHFHSFVWMGIVLVDGKARRHVNLVCRKKKLLMVRADFKRKSLSLVENRSKRNLNHMPER